MPYRRTYQRKFNRINRINRLNRLRRRRFYRKGKSTYFANKNMVSYMAPLQQPIPPRYRCKFSIGCQVNVDPATTPASAGFLVDMNAIYQPFNGSFAAAPWANFAPGAPSTLQPAGYSALLNNDLYRYYRVYSSRIIIKAIPSAQADTVMVTCTPALVTQGPSSTATALAQPYTKSRLFQSSQIGVIKNYIAQHTIVGTTKRAIEDDLSANYMASYTTNPAQLIRWFIFWNTVDAIGLSTPLIFDVQVEYYCELFANYTAQLTQA